MYNFCEKLFPICRSITGDGVRETLKQIKENIPSLTIHEVPSGEKCFDWIVPDEWNILDAYIIDPDGKKIVDFKENNLHLVGYSIPVDTVLSLEELSSHLYTLTDQPDAIPYVTSYYSKRWGFCISENQKKTLKQGKYQIKIDSSLKKGHLTYGEVLIQGQSTQEIFLSTYICHPSLANNELSGPVVTSFLIKWLLSQKELKYSFRIVFIPETIGSIVYLSKNWQEMKNKMIAGFNITCIGDDRTYSYLESRNGNTLADSIASHVLKHSYPTYHHYSFLERGSDERQYCSPGIDLPVVSIMRSKYNEYPEYHTSMDNLSIISPSGLMGGYKILKKCIESLFENIILQNSVKCEPQLGPRGLYPTISKKGSAEKVRTMMNLIAYCDGKNTMLEIAEKINQPIWELSKISKELVKAELLYEVKN